MLRDEEVLLSSESESIMGSEAGRLLVGDFEVLLIEEGDES